MKTYLASSVIKVMTIKSTIGYPYKTVRMPKLKNKNTKCLKGYRATGTLKHC